MTSASAAISPGFSRLARFRVLRELGRGAQARVMLAHDPRLDREVALKLLTRVPTPVRSTSGCTKPAPSAA
jgi:hypothetical protein